MGRLESSFVPQGSRQQGLEAVMENKGDPAHQGAALAAEREQIPWEEAEVGQCQDVLGRAKGKGAHRPHDRTTWKSWCLGMGSS
jgi:hypothetical protein